MNHGSSTLPGTPERLEEIRRLCREAHAALGPARRDDLLQLWITQGMSPAQRLELTRMLCNAAVAFHRHKSEYRPEAMGVNGRPVLDS